MDKEREAQLDELKHKYDELTARSGGNVIIEKYARVGWCELCLRAIEILANMGVEGA